MPNAVWEDLPDIRYELKNPTTGEITTVHLKPDEETNRSMFQDSETGQDLEVVEKMPFAEWIAEHYTEYGASLEYVTDRSQEGSQFCRGFGGVGGVLRWKVDFVEVNDALEQNGGDFDSDDDFM